jgi:hypothetical protein
MSKTALFDAVGRFDLPRVKSIIAREPALRELRSDRGFNLLQMCCARRTDEDPAKAARQLSLARWLVDQGFDPRETYTTEPGDDGEEQEAQLSLVFFAVARAQNNRLARFFLESGAAPRALFAAAWWGNAEIVEDLVRHGADINEVVGGTPLHMAVAVLDRGVEGRPERARRRLEVLEELLRLGADPDIRDDRGNTPLHTALEKGYDIEVFTLLLEHGANPDIPGKDARTVREIASRKRDRRYADVLDTVGGRQD